ncbi:hypothetical protein Poli38472_002185 [Pythium oligandrum]|uniref:Uncharacterized protein n=1 Tax=Pythium oligandrum TaxID=41045 RepID=A0A8K1CHP1_PYTOL|nr:hypothetical protein Poli38472_002185 [Pythium oligandrum]|eukprot:TMW63244.1 hypothetical protein Poli38472_002185 [Pythium oligandrum]
MASPKDATTALMASAAATAAGSYLEETRTEEIPEIPIRVTLGDATLSMGISGQWELEHSALQECIQRAEQLKERNDALEKENALLKERCTRLTEESNMEKFKCQLLVEMLALSSLDEERSRVEAESERARTASLRNDLLVLMEKARKEGVDVRSLAAVLPVP